MLMPEKNAMEETGSLRIGPLMMTSPLMLSPMAGFTNLPFRVAMRRMGGLSVATTDLVSARSLIELNPKAVRMVSTCPDDRPLGVQLFGGRVDDLRHAARFLEDLGVDMIDINLGCPSEKVTRSGAGAALMQDEELTEELVGAVVDAVDLPVTVKMRLGWDEGSINAHEIAPRLESMGVAAVAIHGRTKEQGYSGCVNLEGIGAVVRSVRRIPVIGNGDVHNHLDARRMIREVGCAGVMVGRAALRDPFFFAQSARFLEDGTEPKEVPVAARVLFSHYHFRMAERYLGVEEACILFRKVLTGYTEFYAEKERWRVRAQKLAEVGEYERMYGELSPQDWPETCRRPACDPDEVWEQLAALAKNSDICLNRVVAAA